MGLSVDLYDTDDYICSVVFSLICIHMMIKQTTTTKIGLQPNDILVIPCHLNCLFTKCFTNVLDLIEEHDTTTL